MQADRTIINKSFIKQRKEMISFVRQKLDQGYPLLENGQRLCNKVNNLANHNDCYDNICRPKYCGYRRESVKEYQFNENRDYI